jgi:hypothetical protein
MPGSANSREILMVVANFEPCKACGAKAPEPDGWRVKHIGAEYVGKMQFGPSMEFICDRCAFKWCVAPLYAREEQQ